MTTETITWLPVVERLPDADTNVLLALADGTTCEGFLDVAGDGVSPLWRDVCAVPIEQGYVTHWADMPGGPVNLSASPQREAVPA